MMDLNYTVVRSAKRRKLTITVERDRTRGGPCADASTSDEKMRRVVDAKRQWILEKIRHPQKYQDLPHPPGKEVVNGESALYLGPGLPDRDRRRRTQARSSSRSSFFIPAAHRAQNAAEACESGTSARAKEKIIPRVQQHARELGVELLRREDRRQPISLGLMHGQRQREFQLAPDQGADVRDRLRHRARTGPSDRSQSHAPVLEHRPRSGTHDGEGEGVVERAWSTSGTNNMREMANLGLVSRCSF